MSSPIASPRIAIHHRYQDFRFFEERLSEAASLEMMQIPGGTFLMGSPEGELERYKNEGPQHEVSIPGFFMAKYPITQAQWRAVAALTQSERELDPDPSHFKGDDRPVETVSWLDAVEFCQRLSQGTGREYRLPSEAEWEYACRAGTTTPFHFGETITTEVANYRGTDWDYEGKTYPGSYGRGPLGEYRKETTPVDHFGIANGFGLCEMHGNVWEWCADHWHDNYEGALNNKTIWLSSDESSERVIRGGSWNNNPRNCRSAVRIRGDRDYAFSDLGFRVVCVALGA